MPHTLDPETRQRLLAELRNTLDTCTVQTLRQAARAWGWPLRGTAKSDLIGQMAGYLGDRARMADDLLTLPEDMREVYGWLSALRLSVGDPSRTLQQVLALTSGRQMTMKAIKQHITSLQERCLIFISTQNQYFAPALFLEWLPPLEASQLRYPEQPQAAPEFTVAAFNQHVQHLLANVEADRPAAASPTPSGAYSPMERFSASVAPRPGPVAAETIARWGYLTRDERSLAGFLLDQMVNAGLCAVDMHSSQRRLALVSATVEAWDVFTPVERLLMMQERWRSADPGRPSGAPNFWSELDLALPRVQHYVLRASYYWSPTETLHTNMTYLRNWLLPIAQALTPGTWYSVERLCELVYQLRRDLLAWGSMPAIWRWYRDTTSLDPQQITFEVWRATYGRLVEAWLSGPLSWLLFAQVGYVAGKPAAFCMLSAPPPGDAAAIPADALRFTSDKSAVLRNTWQTGGLRQLLRRFATETARDIDTTTYRLDTGTFRRTLQAGQTATELIQAFADNGFPLPPDTTGELRAWQARAGRHQLYDQVAVIEFNETLHPEEVRAIAGLGSGQFYQASPQCLVVLNPESVPGIIEELRRRGYTPQVTS